MTAGIVYNETMGNVGLRQFPASQRGALVARPGFIHPDMQGNIALCTLVDDRQSRAPVYRGQSAGVAVGQNIEPILAAALLLPETLYQICPVITDGLADCDVFFFHELGELKRLQYSRFCRYRPQRSTAAVQCPLQIHRGGSGRS